MGKRRVFRTFAAAITKIMGELTDERCGEVIDRSASLVRKFSDPELDSLPNLKQAVLLDAAYVNETGEPAPLLEVYTHQLEALTVKQTASNKTSLKDASMILQCGIGALSSAVLDALSPHSEEGAKLSANEYADIMATFGGLVEQVNSAERAIKAAFTPNVEQG